MRGVTLTEKMAKKLDNFIFDRFRRINNRPKTILIFEMWSWYFLFDSEHERKLR